MTSQDRGAINLDLTLVTDDLQRLYAQSLNNPGGQEARLLTVTLNHLQRLKDGGRSTHQLSYLPSYPDLSDCQTTYVGTDPNARPTHRLIWRDRLPTEPGQPLVRQVIALGEREHGAAYHLAGSRLGRPRGLTLADLASAPEPIRTTGHHLEQSTHQHDHQVELD